MTLCYFHFLKKHLLRQKKPITKQKPIWLFTFNNLTVEPPKHCNRSRHFRSTICAVLMKLQNTENRKKLSTKPMHLTAINQRTHNLANFERGLACRRYANWAGMQAKQRRWTRFDTCGGVSSKHTREPITEPQQTIGASGAQTDVWFLTVDPARREIDDKSLSSTVSYDCTFATRNRHSAVTRVVTTGEGFTRESHLYTRQRNRFLVATIDNAGISPSAKFCFELRDWCKHRARTFFATCLHSWVDRKWRQIFCFKSRTNESKHWLLLFCFDLKSKM